MNTILGIYPIIIPMDMGNSGPVNVNFVYAAYIAINLCCIIPVIYMMLKWLLKKEWKKKYYSPDDGKFSFYNLSNYITSTFFVEICVIFFIVVNAIAVFCLLVQLIYNTIT